VAGAALRALGGAFYKPDVATAAYRRAGLSEAEANTRAWHRGRVQLEQAISGGTDYAFETTLGGRTITGLLRRAAEEGNTVRMWYVGLDSVERHIGRVRARVARGGHDIPEEKIRERWDASRKNLVRLLPFLAELRVFDNSEEVAPAEGRAPSPRLLLHVTAGGVVAVARPEEVPSWAKAIMAAALRPARRR
jgi:predicted ABC-type ATPase